MPVEPSSTRGAPEADARVAAHQPEEWAQEPFEELPPRPRRRLLGTGANPAALGLIGVLLLAGGFIGGVLVEKGETGGSPSAAPGASARGASAPGASAGGSAGRGGGLPGRLGGFGRTGGATIGEVAYVSGNTLYVTNFEGATVRVNTSPASSITKTVKASLRGVHPGETVVVRGSGGAKGAIEAESVSVGGTAAAGAGGALGGLFGGAGGRGGGGGRGRGGATGKGTGGQALFGE